MIFQGILWSQPRFQFQSEPCSLKGNEKLLIVREFKMLVIHKSERVLFPYHLPPFFSFFFHRKKKTSFFLHTITSSILLMLFIPPHTCKHNLIEESIFVVMWFHIPEKKSNKRLLPTIKQGSLTRNFSILCCDYSFLETLFSSPLSFSFVDFMKKVFLKIFS